MTNLDSILKSRDITLFDNQIENQGYISVQHEWGYYTLEGLMNLVTCTRNLQESIPWIGFLR